VLSSLKEIFFLLLLLLILISKAHQGQHANDEYNHLIIIKLLIVFLNSLYRAFQVGCPRMCNEFLKNYSNTFNVFAVICCHARQPT